MLSSSARILLWLLETALHCRIKQNFWHCHQWEKNPILSKVCKLQMTWSARPMDKITCIKQFLKTGSNKDFVAPVNHEEVTLGYQIADCKKNFQRIASCLIVKLHESRKRYWLSFNKKKKDCSENVLFEKHCLKKILFSAGYRPTQEMLVLLWKLIVLCA